ncbi:NADAR family protein [Phanerochaete sordida]|uniref:NADAR family protein n=1 Tax=Phanerochaete sordida TaxID=48140 RepID=A0A9P3LIL1_9APHY|nr:NADAR family protein [Phanerochaete sordida]
MSTQPLYTYGYVQYSNPQPVRPNEEQPGTSWTSMPIPSWNPCDTTMSTHHIVVPTPPLSPSASSEGWAWRAQSFQLQAQGHIQPQSSHGGQAHYSAQPPSPFSTQYPAQSQYAAHLQSVSYPPYPGQPQYSGAYQHTLQLQQAFQLQQPLQAQQPLQSQQSFQLQQSVQPQQPVQPQFQSPPVQPVQPAYEQRPPSQPRPRSRSRPRTPARSRRTPEPPLYFYDRNEDYYEFTNFAPFPVWHGGNQYPTSEHLFQAHKFLENDPHLAERIRQQPTPRAALQEATRNRPSQRKDWFHVNIAFMDGILEAKFTQHQGLRELLLSTGNRELIEDSPVDAFWGCGADRKGKNELGKCLMRLRAKFRENDREHERREWHREEDRQNDMLVDVASPTRALPETRFQGY